MEHKDNVTLLLLQLLLYRQQELVHNNRALDYERLLMNPTVDEEVLKRFTRHKLVRLYCPYICDIQLRGMKSIVQDIFTKGLKDNKGNVPVTLVTLANHYYRQRIQQLEKEELPKLKELIQSNLNG
ncbi:Swc7p Ecym_3278 [Eremothecium cymbalariae DBVPG|uniref:Uncharacterized protein n=1 Tax=Eremothecium cymbalariae (strain CBS 270.75 / DBVPG 7215 / KCTC 17166 / NRRL Y-17582) TaxID=931890 RepID=G8JRK2_ERECY|nr:Hypothetical protein Ecym_3278 [Eremothecium cymbalariae DBVPG\